MKLTNILKIKYLSLLFIFSCSEEPKIKQKKPEIIEFVVKEKTIIKTPKYYEFYLKSEDTIFEVNSKGFVFFEVSDTLFLDKKYGTLYLNQYKKAIKK